MERNKIEQLEIDMETLVLRLLRIEKILGIPDVGEDMTTDEKDNDRVICPHCDKRSMLYDEKYDKFICDNCKKEFNRKL
jgi:hypothetical protein